MANNDDLHGGSSRVCARMGSPALLARRRVDAVDVDKALLPGDVVHDLLALRRGVGQGGTRAYLQPALQGLVGDEAVVPKVLEHADRIDAVVGHAISDLEVIKLNYI
jgi:hypothetical protein